MKHTLAAWPSNAKDFQVWKRGTKLANPREISALHSPRNSNNK